MEFNALLLDLDGTLVNSLPDIAGVINLVRQSLGAGPLSDAQVLPHVGHGAHYLVKNCLADVPNVLSLSDRVTQYKESFATWVPRGNLYPGVKETLLEFRKRPNLRLAVVTNKSTTAAKLTLGKYLPEVSFDEIAGPEMVSHYKPHPAHALEVLARIGVPAERATFVGDHNVDRDCAQAAGIRFFGACYGFCAVDVPKNQRLTHFSELLEKVR